MMEENKQDTIASPASVANCKKKREDKIRRRDFRALDNVLKSIISLSDTEKIQALSTKYGELYEEYRNLQLTYTAIKKRCDVLQKEKDQLANDQSKCVLARSRMENLCRELQRQNKLIKEENLAKIREEEERRKEVAAKFQATLTELTGLMQENSEKNTKLRDDNLDMANKISSLCEQFEKREEQITRMEKQMDLERQLAEATVAKVKFELQAERELWAKEREALQNNLKKSEDTGVQLQTNVKALEEHLQLYTGKYEEFETTISKSNKVFDNCKSEMLKMSKQIMSLEKEAKTWKLRWQKNAQSLLELSESKQTQDIELAGAERKIEQLQKLCRQLQIDRAAYLKLLKVHNIEASSQVCMDDNPPPPQTIVQKSTKKEKELKLLKNNLKVLQNQLSGIQNEKTNAETAILDNEEITELKNSNQESVINEDSVSQEISVPQAECEINSEELH